MQQSLQSIFYRAKIHRQIDKYQFLLKILQKIELEISVDTNISNYQFF